MYPTEASKSHREEEATSSPSSVQSPELPKRSLSTSDHADTLVAGVDGGLSKSSTSEKTSSTKSSSRSSASSPAELRLEEIEHKLAKRLATDLKLLSAIEKKKHKLQQKRRAAENKNSKPVVDDKDQAIIEAVDTLMKESKSKRKQRKAEKKAKKEQEKQRREQQRQQPTVATNHTYREPSIMPFSPMNETTASPFHHDRRDSSNHHHCSNDNDWTVTDTFMKMFACY